MELACKTKNWERSCSISVGVHFNQLSFYLVINCCFFSLFVYSYDGSGNNGVNDPPYRGQSPHQSPSRYSYNNSNNNKHSSNNNNICNNNQGKSGLNWRTNSFGASDFKRGSPARSSYGNKMGDLNVPRGHSPNFSPSRAASGEFLEILVSCYVSCYV